MPRFGVAYFLIMIKYIFKRILQAIPVIICVAVLIFCLMRLSGGDPALQLLGVDATEEQYLAKRAELHLDEPVITQLAAFLSNFFLHGNLGTSYVTRTPISKDLKLRIPYSLKFGGISIVISTIIGVWLGIQSAIHAGKWQDKSCMIFALAGVSVPTFWLALLLMLLFSVKLRWLPTFGVGSFKHYILPVLTMSIHGIATFARQARSSMLEVIRSDYVITAKAKGLSYNEVIYKHALPNALIPIVTIVGSHFAFMICGSVVIETIFAIPGMGQYLTSAIGNRDYPVVQGVIVVLSIFFCLVMLLIDIAYAFLDPRIKARYMSAKKVTK